MRKIEQQIIDTIREEKIQSVGVLYLSCRDAVIRDADDKWHVVLHDTDIARINLKTKKMWISMHGYGTPTTMSRIKALLSYFAEDGYTLTRDPKLTYIEYSEWQGKEVLRKEPLLLSPSGQRVYLRDTTVMLSSDHVYYWGMTQPNTWQPYPEF